MQEWVDQLFQYLQTDFNVWGLVILFFAAAIEYVFPPFPGDTVTLVGAIVTQAMGWHFTVVFGVVTTGSLVGAAADYYIGVWLAKKGHLGEAPRADPPPPSRWRRVNRQAVEGLLAKFAKYGEVYIAINRFLPGIRAFFFLAAGMARMRFWRVMLFAAISALAWDGLIVAVGYAIGANREKLVAFLESYSSAVWAAMGVVALTLTVRWLWMRRKRRRGEGAPAADA